MVNFPVSKVKCSDLHGEYYLHISCEGLCEEEKATCPLNNIYWKVKHDSCSQQFPNRIYTIADDSFLTFVINSSHGEYHQNFFRCDNGRCVEYSQVCDLVDDCGDDSDEMHCVNHMICENTIGSGRNQFIALEQKCDGIYDCFDLSDECNDSCNREILQGRMLKLSCLIIGTMAVIFNGVSLVTGFISMINECLTEKLMITKVLISLIGSGDFLIGVYLILLYIYDSLVYGISYCQHQPEWLTGRPCMILGVISTVGSQVSVFSMTALSCIIAYGVLRKNMRMPSSVTRKSVLKAAILATTIFAISLAVALIPLIPSLEDYFVEGMYYDFDNKIFVGFPTKDRHIAILKEYYDLNQASNENSISSDLSWSEIAEKVNGMFTQDYGILTGKPVHFYGNDGLCLFKYFVRTDDARRTRMKEAADITDKKGDFTVWTMLILNLLLCFAVITGCYVAIIWDTKKSTHESGQWDNQGRLRENKAMQNRIALLIVTDFICWVPFIIISGFHNLGQIDATMWYTPLALILLPINSIINPLLYNVALVEFIGRKLEQANEFIAERCRNISTRITFTISSLFRRNNGNASHENSIPMEPINQ